MLDQPRPNLPAPEELEAGVGEEAGVVVEVVLVLDGLVEGVSMGE